VIQAIELGLLTPQDLAQYDSDAQRGLADGTAQANRPHRKLLDPGLSEQLGESFLPFPTTGSRPVKRMIATSDRPTTEEERAMLRQEAEAGWVVHLIEPSDRLHTIDFDDGVWIDLLAPEAVGQDLTSWPELLQSEVARLSSARDVQLTVAIESVQAAVRNRAAATSGSQNSAQRA
jgi:hypothetical protein